MRVLISYIIFLCVERLSAETKWGALGLDVQEVETMEERANSGNVEGPFSAFSQSYDVHN